MVSRGGNLHLAGLEELLVTAIQQASYLAIQQPAGACQYLDQAIRSGRNLCRTPVFPYLNSIWGAFCTVVSRCNIESLAAKQGENVVEGAVWGLLCHKCNTLDSL